MARTWQIDCKGAWLVIRDAISTSVIEGERVEVFGTVTGGFAITAAGERMFFEAAADHARDCVNRLIQLLTEAE